MASSVPGGERKKGAANNRAVFWEMDGSALEKWALEVPALFDPEESKRLVDPSVAKQIWKNLSTALETLTCKERPKNDSDNNATINSKSDVTSAAEGEENGKPAKKRRRKVFYDISDPYNLYLHTIPEADPEDLALGIDPYQDAATEMKSTTGGKVSQLTLSGIVNGMAGQAGGVVTSKNLQTIDSINPKSTPLANASNLTLAKLKVVANAFYQAIQARVQADVLRTTPGRIQEMLAADLTSSEFKAIRKRVYDTVILGKGMNTGQPEEGSDLPTGASSGVHEVERFKKCKSCGNNDQSLFVLDKKNGDVICSNCGTVASESLMHEGSAYRKFEGELDRNHHGDAPNSLYSNAYNTSTTLGGMQMQTGAGGGGYGTQSRGMENILRNAHAYTELNISQFGKGDRRTRTGYKDKQKRDAFIQMAHCGDALNLHEAVVQRAKEVFAGFRDDRELVQQFKGVVAACLCEAFEQLSKDGKQILKQKEEAAPSETFSNPRANRRNELHHANLAGKGGLLLDYSSMSKKEEALSTVAQKPTATWDLDDCRSWLMEASRSITQQWIKDRKDGATDIPNGTQEELEGKLVEHAITLNDALEAEVKQQAGSGLGAGGGRGRVITPRVTDMSKLGIKWQHSHERGSGGKGGVGGSGNGHIGAGGRGTTRSGRTAGQILILKTAKKLGLILKDPFAGQSIHKELRSLINRQDAQKRKLQLEETTRQRFSQMKRKPWLQAKADASS